jgi:hypothetical protein
MLRAQGFQHRISFPRIDKLHVIQDKRSEAIILGLRVGQIEGGFGLILVSISFYGSPATDFWFGDAPELFFLLSNPEHHRVKLQSFKVPVATFAPPASGLFAASLCLRIFSLIGGIVHRVGMSKNR